MTSRRAAPAPTATTETALQASLGSRSKGSGSGHFLASPIPSKAHSFLEGEVSRTERKRKRKGRKSALAQGVFFRGAGTRLPHAPRSAESHRESDHRVSQATDRPFPLPMPKSVQVDRHPSANILTWCIFNSHRPLTVRSGPRGPCVRGHRKEEERLRDHGAEQCLGRNVCLVRWFYLTTPDPLSIVPARSSDGF